jgi:TonB family protein
VHADSPASKGAAPQFARFQLSVPTVEILNDHPILPMVPTLIGEEAPQTNFDYKQYGDPNGVLGKLSGGPGTGGGIGPGDGTGIGPGRGPGLGPGENGGEGGGAVDFRSFGKGSITAPILVAKFEPEYSEEARRARVQGTVLLRIEVDTDGHARNIMVSRSLGLGLDEQAKEAVQRWKFTAGKVNGKPTVMVAYVEVNFRLL